MKTYSEEKFIYDIADGAGDLFTAPIDLFNSTFNIVVKTSGMDGDGTLRFKKSGDINISTLATIDYVTIKDVTLEDGMLTEVYNSAFNNPLFGGEFKVSYVAGTATEGEITIVVRY